MERGGTRRASGSASPSCAACRSYSAIPSSFALSSAAAAPQAEARRQAAEADAASGSADRESRTLASKLGTGFGRSETSHAQRVRFERASTTPAETVSVQYDRRENLVAMGVLASPRYAQRAPDPFPGMRFVPEPR